jgi:transposase
MEENELEALIRRHFHVDHWPVGTIATQLQISADKVRGALDTSAFNEQRTRKRKRMSDPYLPLITETLEKYPTLRSTRIWQMVRELGYAGSQVQLRRIVRELRPPQAREPFLRLNTLPGEQAQVDWADFGSVMIGQARRRLSAFVMTLSYSRALYVEFFLDQKLETFLLGHVRAFAFFGGVPRWLVHDNLKAAVIERVGRQIRLHPRFVELLDHYRIGSRACRPRRGNEKGRVERSIRYLRDSFFAGRPWPGLERLNREVAEWCEKVAHARKHPQEPALSVGEALEHERERLIVLPQHPFSTDLSVPVMARRMIYVRFDRNDYSIPPDRVGVPLTLYASDVRVRIVCGSELVAEHRRCWNERQTIEDAAHREALLAIKRAGAGATLPPELDSIPLAATLIERAVGAGAGYDRIRKRLAALLREYGAAELADAIATVLCSASPQIEAVAYQLEKARREAHRQLSLPLDLSHRPELDRLRVKPHSTEIYDELILASSRKRR